MFQVGRAGARQKTRFSTAQAAAVTTKIAVHIDQERPISAGQSDSVIWLPVSRRFLTAASGLIQIAANTRTGARSSSRRRAGCSRSLAEASSRSPAAGSPNNQVANRLTRRQPERDHQRCRGDVAGGVVYLCQVQLDHLGKVARAPSMVWPWLATSTSRHCA